MIVAGSILLLTVFLAFMFYASYSIRSGVYLNAFCRMQTHDKVVALTFDDGPDAVQTPRVLDILKEYDAPATFFCIGSKVEGNEDIIRRIIAEGHRIGNHSYTHSGTFPLYPGKRMTADLERCQQVLEKTTGQKVDWFRPPFGVTNPTIARVVRKLRYQTIGWSIRTLDTQPLSHKEIIKRINKRLRPGSIILLHDRMPQSEVLLKDILDELKQQGYRVVHPEVGPATPVKSFFLRKFAKVKQKQK